MVGWTQAGRVQADGFTLAGRARGRNFGTVRMGRGGEIAGELRVWGRRHVARILSERSGTLIYPDRKCLWRTFRSRGCCPIAALAPSPGFGAWQGQGL